MNAYVQKHCPAGHSPARARPYAYAGTCKADSCRRSRGSPRVHRAMHLKKAECLEDASDLAYAVTFGDLAEWMRDVNVELEPRPPPSAAFPASFPLQAAF